MGIDAIIPMHCEQYNEDAKTYIKEWQWGKDCYLTSSSRKHVKQI